MTLRLRLSSPEPGWTELFRAGPPLRPMRVMADADALRGVSGPVTAKDLLVGLLTSEGILLWRYSDDGPPPGTPQLMTTSGQRVATGWAVVTPAPPGSLTTHALAWAVGQHPFHADLVGEPVLAASTDSRTRAYEALDPDQAAARRTADAVAACAARQIMADLYVTNREYLHRLTGPIGRGVTFCTPRQALALVGLYLRTQGKFLLWKNQADRAPCSFDKGLYYWSAPGSCSRPAGGGTPRASRTAAARTRPPTGVTWSTSAGPSSSGSRAFSKLATTCCAR